MNGAHFTSVYDFYCIFVKGPYVGFTLKVNDVWRQSSIRNSYGELYYFASIVNLYVYVFLSRTFIHVHCRT